MDTSNKQAKKINQGIKLVNKITQLAKRKLTEHAEVDENGDVELPDFDDLSCYVLEDEKLGDAVIEMLKEHYDELSEQVTYEERVAWSDRKERERTDRRAFNAEKSRVVNKINKKYN